VSARSENLTLWVFLLDELKFRWCHIRCYIGCRTECLDTNKKNKLQIPLVNRETNLLNLINSSLAYVYCSTTVSHYGLIRF
jgi:hypothetical protein